MGIKGGKVKGDLWERESDMRWCMKIAIYAEETYKVVKDWRSNVIYGQYNATDQMKRRKGRMEENEECLHAFVS